MEYIPKLLLWLFVINLGIVLGAGLYEARIELPQWLVYSGEVWVSLGRRSRTQGEHWAKVLGLCHNRSAHTAYVSESGCCLAGIRRDSWLVAGRDRSGTGG
jgi:hypothetical protein